jgi:hypothetical protein
MAAAGDLLQQYWTVLCFCKPPHGSAASTGLQAAAILLLHALVGAQGASQPLLPTGQLIYVLLNTAESRLAATCMA